MCVRNLVDICMSTSGVNLFGYGPGLKYAQSCNYLHNANPQNTRLRSFDWFNALRWVVRPASTVSSVNHVTGQSLSSNQFYFPCLERVYTSFDPIYSAMRLIFRSRNAGMMQVTLEATRTPLVVQFGTIRWTPGTALYRCKKWTVRIGLCPCLYD